MDRLTRTGTRARLAGVASAAAIAVAATGCTTGAKMTTPPTFDGPVEQLRVTTVGTFEDLSIGLGNVWADGATFDIAGSDGQKILNLGIGEAGEAVGVQVRLCAVWVDESAGSQPGSDASQAYYVIGRGDTPPDCPAQLDLDA